VEGDITYVQKEPGSKEFVKTKTGEEYTKAVKKYQAFSAGMIQAQAGLMAAKVREARELKEEKPVLKKTKIKIAYSPRVVE
jgi:tartrate dehydratase beta subunit/fumarate hydratase class I family protein